MFVMGTFSLRAAVKMLWYINSFSIKSTIPAMIGPLITRHYCNEIRERGKASENVHFRKIVSTLNGIRFHFLVYISSISF